jgi:hypothetical protein
MVARFHKLHTITVAGAPEAQICSLKLHPVCLSSIPTHTRRRKVHGCAFQSIPGNQLSRTRMKRQNRYICIDNHQVPGRHSALSDVALPRALKPYTGRACSHTLANPKAARSNVRAYSAVNDSLPTARAKGATSANTRMPRASPCSWRCTSCKVQIHGVVRA